MASAKKATIILLLGITALASAAIVAASVPLLGCDAQSINLAMPQAGSREIRPGNSIRQEILATANNLSRVEVYLQTFFRPNTQDVILTVAELPPDARPLDAGTPRAQSRFNAADLPVQGWYAFEFDPLPNSAGRRFVLLLESPGSTPGDAVTVGGVLAADPYPAGDAFVGDSPLGGDVAFRACYRMTPAEKLADLGGQLTAGRPGVWGMPLFYLLLALLYLLLLALLFWLLARRAWPQ